MRIVAAALALALLLPAIVLAAPAPDAGWRAKADAPLLAALDGGAGRVTMVVQGPMPPAPEAPPADRAAWRAHWAAGAEPFLDAVRREVHRLGGTVRLEVPAIAAAFVEVPAGRVASLLGRPEVRRAALDGPGAVRAADGEGPGVAVSTEEALAHLNVPDVWAAGYRGEGRTVAIVDTGLRATHDVFRRADGSTRIVGWYDALGECFDPCDPNGHGTRVGHLAAGGAHFNASAPRGAAPSAGLLGIRVFGAGGGGSWEDAQEGLQAAFDRGADVAANAWGGSCTGAGVATAELAEALADAGMASAFPTGSSNPIGCPGRVPKVVTAGMTDANEVVASNSARGPCTWQNVTRTCPDVMAVAVGLTGASNACDTCYNTQTGSSWSAAQLAGVVALLEQASAARRGADLTPAEADEVLRATARDLGAEGPDNDYGWGMADADAARAALGLGAPGEVRHRFLVSPPVVHRAQVANVTLELTNMGPVPVDGRVRVTARQTSFGECPPACEASVLVDEVFRLASFQAAAYRAAFAADAHAPGTYEVRAEIALSWTDPVTGEPRTGELALRRDLEVRKVLWAPSRGIPAAAPIGTAHLDAALVWANVGNEQAAAVRILEHFAPQGHLPLPQVPPASGTFGAFATPAPLDVALDPNSAAYAWATPGIAPGAAWSARYSVLALRPGAWVFDGGVTYQDETGRTFGQSFDTPAAVTLPLP